MDFGNMTKEYISLLIKREKNVVLGKYYANLWLLTIVLVATFISIAFSNASLSYLAVKMDDPFTNWVDVPNNFDNSDKFDKFKQTLEECDSLKEVYLFNNVQLDNFNTLKVYDKNKVNRDYLLHRCFENMNSDLMRAILDKKNIVNGATVGYDEITNKTYGAIITLDALIEKGYTEDSIPSYIYLAIYNTGADSLGVKLDDENHLAVPIPILAVVKRLPSNMDIITSKYLYDAIYSEAHCFSFTKNEDYLKTLCYFVPKEYADSFKNRVSNINYMGINGEIYIEDNPVVKNHIGSWKEGNIYNVYFGNYDTYDACNTLNSLILKECNNTPIRLFNYVSHNNYIPGGSYFSINFESLDSIRKFEQFAKRKFEIVLDMAQVDSKENFNAVSIMANILSVAMIVFSMVCIIMFIVNMLQSYFQKVKRNLGTFKAFGINSSELTNIYVLILLAIVCVAIIIALSATWFIQLILPVLGIMKDGEFNYLELWSVKTFSSYGAHSYG